MKFSDAFNLVTYDLLFHMQQADPALINHGNCEEWANRMVLWVGGEAWWLDTLIDADIFPIDEQPRVAHCALLLDGRWYDSEHPAGVDNILLLAGFDDEQCYRYEGKVLR